MITKEKSVTWQLTLDMPDNYRLEAVADRIIKLIERNEYVLPNIHITEFSLIEEKHNGEVI